MNAALIRTAFLATVVALSGSPAAADTIRVAGQDGGQKLQENCHDAPETKVPRALQVDLPGASPNATQNERTPPAITCSLV